MGAVLDPVMDTISGGKDSASTRASQAAVDAMRNVQLPDIAAMQVQLEQLVQSGQMSPEEAQAVLVERSSMQDISTDPRLKTAQMDALNSLQDIGANGMTAMDRAKLEQIKGDLGAQERGQRDAILQQAQQRGIGGSGIELMAQLQNQQASAGRASQMGFDVQAAAQERALQALQQSGALAGNMQNQDFNQQSQIAQAQDAIAKFNAQNQQQVGMTNTAARNTAQQQNLAEKQRIADANVGMRNEQQQYNKGLAQTQFQNQIAKAGGQASALQNQAQALGQQGAARQQFLGGLVSAGATAAASDERVKKDIEPFDTASFLDSITGYKYNYKSPEKHGQGPQVGVMAQDVEKMAPQAVQEDQEGTKVINYDKLGGPILASLADMNDRLKKMEGK